MYKTIGIIGGGQLALMLVLAASKFGVKCICLDPNKEAVAFKSCYKSIIAKFHDQKALEELIKACDVVIYEFENIDLETLNKINTDKLYQGIDVLKYSQNRILEKDLAIKSGFETTKYKEIYDAQDLKEAISKIGMPGILKTQKDGYDGKGQVVIQNHTDLKKLDSLLEVPCIYEQKIEFDFEMSLIGVRDKNNDFKIFPPFINEHVNGILHKTELNKKLINTDLYKESCEIFKKFMKSNEFYGILCIEFFIKDQKIYFNEMAPRPHNSGHITLDATFVSQFEQTIRAALGYKLLDPKIIKEMSMINILGQNYDKAKELLHISPYIKIYDYGKEEVRQNRKMGHINLDNEDLINKISKEFKNAK